MKKFLSLVLALAMTMSLVTISAGAKDFTDADDIQYAEAVEVMTAIGVVDGDTAGNFNPTAGLTRGAAAKIICNLILGPTTAAALNADTNPYKDVDKNSTFAGYIAFCAKEGIISGYADGTFKPAAPLTGYAFMKMLLGALGYDKSVEGYEGANWSVNVAKRALNIGLDDGLNGTFVGSAYVTREEAMLYAFNALQADMVTYDTTITIGDVTIAGSKAEVMENNGKTDGNIGSRDGVMQFAEKYFTNLKANGDRDDFYRPATTWKLKAETIGTYTETPDLTYTAGVKAGAIYSDLGCKVEKANVDVYVNGVIKSAYATAISKGSDVEVGEYGNGVLTEVYYDADNESAEIIQVLTYVGQVEKTVKATATKDAYIVLSDASATGYGLGTLTFETDEVFEDDAYVYFTYSQMPSVDEVKSVELAEVVTGTVTRAENKDAANADSQNLTIAGETYKTSYKFGGVEFSDVTIKEDYNVYMDSYGYAILVEKVEDLSSEYALLVGYQNGNNWSTNKARLIFADGTEAIVNTDKDYQKAGASYRIELGTLDTNGNVAAGSAKIVTWKVNEDGEYALRAVTTTAADTDSANFLLDSGVAKVTVDTGTDVYANSATTFVVYENDNDEWNAYTGVKSAPTVQATSSIKVDSYTYVKNGMVKIMFVLPDADSIVTNDSAKVTFVAKDSVTNLIHDGNDSYFVYNAIVNGEITTIKVDYVLGNAMNGFFKSYTFNKHDVMTGMTPKATDSADLVYSGENGVSKTSADYTVSFAKTDSGYTYTYTVADDADIYYVDEDGKITESSYRAIVKDDNDKVYAIVDKGSYMIETLIIEEVDDDEIPEGPVVNNDYAATAAITGASAITVKAINGTTNVAARDVAISMLRNAGYTNISVNGMTVTATDMYGTSYTYTVSLVEAYKVTFELQDTNITADVASLYVAEGDEVTVNVTATGSWAGFVPTVKSGTPVANWGTFTNELSGKVQTVKITAPVMTADVTVTLGYTTT